MPLLLLAALAAPGCQGGYVLRQAIEQWRLSRRQIDLAAPEVGERLAPEQRDRLPWVKRILEFSREELALTPGDSYQTFLDVEGRPVSYIVIAAHPEALVAYEWCFPFVGCVSYKGFFSEQDASEEAERLRRQDWDVEVFQVRAFSTLGWFRDPVLSTMLDLEIPDLAELLIHETVHRTFYVADRTTFNESLATHVAREGTLLFLERYKEEIPPEIREEYLQEQMLADQDDLLMRRLRRDLEALYSNPPPGATVRARKAEMLATARRARGILHGFPFSSPATNAGVLAAETYQDLRPDLERLQERAGGHPRDLMAYLMAEMEERGTLPEELR